MRGRHFNVGGTNFLTALKFADWAAAQHAFPMPEQVIARFHCSRATAHRWLNLLAEFRGIDRPKRDSSGQIRNQAA